MILQCLFYRALAHVTQCNAAYITSQTNVPFRHISTNSAVLNKIVVHFAEKGLVWDHVWGSHPYVLQTVKALCGCMKMSFPSYDVHVAVSDVTLHSITWCVCWCQGQLHVLNKPSCVIKRTCTFNRWLHHDTKCIHYTSLHVLYHLSSKYIWLTECSTQRLSLAASWSLLSMCTQSDLPCIDTHGQSGGM